MRSFIFLLCISTFGFTPDHLLSQNEKISIDANKVVTVDEVFEIIKEQTAYRFIYKSGMFDNFPKVSLKRGIIRVNALLKKSLATDTLNFSFGDNGTIVITEKATPLQAISISGKVVDVNGMPLPGLTVYVTDREPTLNKKIERDFIIHGTTTDFDGNYDLEAEVGYYLVVTGIGYEFQYQKITSQTVYDIVLKERVSELDEVVLIGYGQQRREEITAAVSTVKSEDITKNARGAVSFDRSLQGLMKGVNVVANSGDPSGSVDINIRGFISPFSGSDNNPLFVIDGVPFQADPNSSRVDETRFNQVANPLLALNPNEIESIDVLKDAAATAIYGSRGANGVIIVNTKKGKRGEKTRISFNSTVSMSQPIALDNYLSTEQWKAHLDTYFTNTSQAMADGNITNPSHLSPFGGLINLDANNRYAGLNEANFGTANTNWADVIYRSQAYTKNYNLSVRGGTESTGYSLNLGYTDKKGLIIEDGLKQYNVRLALDTRLNKTLEIGTNINLNYSNRNVGSSNNGIGLYPDGILETRPDQAAYDANGNPILRVTGDFFGRYPWVVPTPYATVTAHSNNTKGYNILGNAYMKVNVTDNLNVKVDVNGGLFMTDSYFFRPASIMGGAPLGFPEPTSAQSGATDQQSINTNLTTDFTTNYNNTFGKHTVGGTLGFSWLRDKADRSYSFYRGFPDDLILTNPSNTTERLVSSSSILDYGLNSIFGRLTYNFDSRYFFTLTARQDKSSRFPAGNKEAFFPSISASWNVANEAFLNESEQISLLRLRASAGRSGSTNIADFSYLQGFETGQRAEGLYAGAPAVGLGSTLANPNVKWEETDEINIGLDFGLFNNRLRGSVDVYDRKTTGALVNTPIPLETGLSSFTSNFVDLTNKGFEIELGGDIIKSENFRWSANINASQNRNKVVNLPTTITNSVFPQPYAIGEPVSVIRGFHVESIFQSQDEVNALNAASPTGNYMEFQYGIAGAGDYKYTDTNGDGRITREDYQVLGSAEPDLFGGFSTNIEYKGFELAAYFTYVYGGEAYYFEGILSPSPYRNTTSVFNDRWTPTNIDARFARLVYRGFSYQDINGQLNSRQIYDRSYLRLANIQLTYNLPTEPIKILGLSSASVFVSGTNLATWTKEYPGLDPGMIGAGLNGFGFQGYPNAKSWNFGINLNF